MTRRALFMATGANRGAWYAGFLGPLAEAGIEFDLLAGVSAGGIAACSPSGVAALCRTLAEHRRPERLVVITPGEELPAGRWTMDWATLGRTIEMGREDIESAIDRAADSQNSIATGRNAGELEPVIQAR